MQKKAEEWILRDKYHGLRDEGALAQDIERLRAGEPLDYIIGWKSFCGMEVDLTQRPLIPREETEYWVNECIQKIGSRTSGRPKSDFQSRGKSHFQCLDMCSGSGCIAAALLTAFPQAHCDCVDVVPAMLAQVMLTMERNNITPERYRLIESDMWQNVTGKYDLICANPPYVGRGEELGEGVREYEPQEAIFADDGSYAELKKFFDGLAVHLADDGIAYCEFGSGQADFVRSRSIGKHFSITICRDQYGRERYAIVD